jgi:hypothetical protein
LFLKGSYRLDHNQAKYFAINPKFIGELIYYLSEGLIYRVSQILDGCACSHCGEFIPFAAPNQPDGTLKCWSCRENPYR